MSIDVAARYANRTAIVTGAGSGIGAALSRALAAAGARVICTDVDGEAASTTARALTGPLPGEAAELDVTDADAVQTLVDKMSAAHGLDLMFNNAGISFAGEIDDLTLEQWNQIIDINLRGVVHGIAAAYPVMSRQGSGHIVNTASIGGLMAAGLLTSYITTKHAIVGLSLALRSEAAARGVGVTVLCPAAVDTPLLDKGFTGTSQPRDLYTKGQGVRRPYDPDRLAADALRAVARNRPILVAPASARAQWLFGRLAPITASKAAIQFVAKQRALRPGQG